MYSYPTTTVFTITNTYQYSHKHTTNPNFYVSPVLEIPGSFWYVSPLISPYPKCKQYTAVFIVVGEADHTYVLANHLSG